MEVELKLIDASDAGAVWSVGESRSARRILATQTTLAESVAKAIGVELAPSAARARKKSLPVSGGEGFAELYAVLACALHAETEPDGAQSEAGRIRLGEVGVLASASDVDLQRAQIARAMADWSRGEALTFFCQTSDLDPSYAVPYAMVAENVVAVDPQLAEQFSAHALDPELPRTPVSSDGTSRISTTQAGWVTPSGSC